MRFFFFFLPLCGEREWGSAENLSFPCSLGRQFVTCHLRIFTNKCVRGGGISAGERNCEARSPRS